MDHFDQLRQQTRLWLFGGMVATSLSGLTCFALLDGTGLGALEKLIASLAVVIIMASGLAFLISSLLSAPLKIIWQAILHFNPVEQASPPPKVEQLKLGRDLVTNLVAQIYQMSALVTQATQEAQLQAVDLKQNFVAQNLPLPLLVVDRADNVKFANEAAAKYIGINADDMVGKNIYMVLDMSFPSQDTFDNWLKGVKVNTAVAARTWERVRLNVRDDHPARQFDLAAFYNRDNPNQIETMLVLFDHTKQYSQDEQAVSFIALSVHELRTPLTLLRGYIEVFEQELSGKMDPELEGFMFKMRAMSDELMAFVNNILNVARVDDDQLELKLQSEDWANVLKSSINTIGLRAKVRGIKIEGRVSSNLPPVGIDRISIKEVINNLVDNAIKYSGDSKLIKIESKLNQEGLVETTVQDFGVGIPGSVLSKLFTKFYRDHRHRAQVGGTGLGLYLCKAIIEAHGGSIWVKSKEGEGAIFGFTLVPYAKLAEEQKLKGEVDITRSAHGWIKNHSLYRR